MNKKAIFFRTGYLLSALSAAWLFGGCGEPVKPPIVPEVSSVFMESSQGEFEEEWKETAPSDVPEESEDSFSEETSPEELSMAEEGKRRDYLVVIDAGHQKKGNSEKEPIGPGATEEKARQHIIMATCMRENTPRAAVMGMEYTHLQMARNTRVHGFRTSSTAKARIIS